MWEEETYFIGIGKVFQVSGKDPLYASVISNGYTVSFIN